MMDFGMVCQTSQQVVISFVELRLNFGSGVVHFLRFCYCVAIEMETAGMYTPAMPKKSKKERTKAVPQDLTELARNVRYYAQQYEAAAQKMIELNLKEIHITGVHSVLVKLDSLQGHINSINGAISRALTGVDDQSTE